MNTPEEKKIPHEQAPWLELLDDFNDGFPYRMPDSQQMPEFRFSLSGVAVIEPFSRHVIYRPYP